MKNRQNSLDILKFIGAYLVVLIHGNIKGDIGDYIRMLCRIAVPIFFLISGFFTYNKDITKIKKSIKKIFKIMMLANLMYFVFEISKNLLMNQPINTILKSLFSLEFIFFNMGEIGSHLWYIRALIYIYLLYIFIIKKEKEKFIPITVLIVYFLDLVICKYSLVIFGNTIPVHIYEPFTKFIGTGFVYFSIGYLLNKNLSKLPKIKFIHILALGILNSVEYFILTKFNLDVSVCNYIFTLPLAISIYMYFLNFNDVSSENILAKIGRDYSLGIYIFHIMFLNILNVMFYDRFEIYMYVRAPLTFAITLLFIYAYKKIIKLEKGKKAHE